jgi:hypothetical protein
MRPHIIDNTGEKNTHNNWSKSETNKVLKISTHLIYISIQQKLVCYIQFAPLIIFYDLRYGASSKGNRKR